jgi:hypothetical protein
MLTLMVLSPVHAAIGLLAYFFIERSRTAGAKPNFGSFISTVGFWAVGALVLAGIIATALRLRPARAFRGRHCWRSKVAQEDGET